MFPIPFNFPFRKSDGSVTTIADAIDAGGGGGSYELPTASANTKGGVKIGSGLTMEGETLNSNNPTPYTLPIASSENLGGVKVGAGLSMNVETGELSNSNPTPYALPTASSEVLGGVKVGAGLAINDGVLSASALTKLWEVSGEFTNTITLPETASSFEFLMVEFIKYYSTYQPLLDETTFTAIIKNGKEGQLSCSFTEQTSSAGSGSGKVTNSSRKITFPSTNSIRFTDADITFITIPNGGTATFSYERNGAKYCPVAIYGIK